MLIHPKLLTCFVLNEFLIIILIGNSILKMSMVLKAFLPSPGELGHRRPRELPAADWPQQQTQRALLRLQQESGQVRLV